jgi:hypothetical protein
MTLTISDMAPLKVNSSVLAITDLQLSPDIIDRSLRHSGNEYKSVGAIPGAKPMGRFKTPFMGAYNLIGMKMLQATVFEYYFATFAAGLRQSGANHSKLPLASGAKAALLIDGASVDQFGLLMADVGVYFLSSDGLTHPIAALASGQSLPTVASEPQLHTLGPFALGVGPTRVDGVTNQGFRQNNSVEAPVNDGDAFPKSCALLGQDPGLAGEHEDPLGLLTSLGLMGLNITTQAVAYFRGIDPTTQLLQATGISIAVTSGRAMPGPVQWGLNRTNRMGFNVAPLSSSQTHPFSINLSATLP